MKSFSKKVTSNQIDIHPDLGALIKRNKQFEFNKPIGMASEKAFERFLNKLSQHINKKTIFDLGCGTGESSFCLSQIYPEHLIVGVDKSESRLLRQKGFKKHPPDHLIFLQCELLDFWLLANKYRSEYDLVKQYLLYPNPWPKKKLIKKRFHAHPIFPMFISLSQAIEMRTNWKIYADEFKFALDCYERRGSEVKVFSPAEYWTNFEKKYSLSGHELYQLKT